MSKSRYYLHWRGYAESEHKIIDSATMRVVETFSPYDGAARQRAIARLKELNTLTLSRTALPASHIRSASA
jgi:hypothetical protein